MSGPGSPGGEGPTEAPPHLPPGWIAQWDSKSKKYYYVQLSTGVSQWEVPTNAAPVGGTPASNLDHPYGVPGAGEPELITHPDGTQTVKHADGRMEPVMPDENGGTTRGGVGNGPSGERGLGSMAMNALLGGKQSSSHGNSSNLGGLASQVFSGLTHSGSSGSHGSSGQSGSGGLGGKLVGQLASNLFSSGNKPQQQQQPQNYHSGQAAQHSSSGGLAGSMMGGVAHMFGGQSQSSGQNYGYSNSGQQGGYSGSAPPTSYQPSGMPQHQAAGQVHTAQSQPPPSYHTPASNGPSHSTPSYQSPSQQPPNPYGHAPQQQQQHGTPSFPPPPPNQYEGGAGQHGYPGPPQHPQYGQPPPHQYGPPPGPPQGPGNPYSSPQHHGGGSFGQQQHHHHQPPSYGGQHGLGSGGFYAQPPGQYPQQPSYGQGLPANHSGHQYGNNPPY